MAVITLTTGADSTALGTDADTIWGRIADITAADIISAGNGPAIDRIILRDGGLLDFRAGGNAAGLTGFESLALAGSNNTVLLAAATATGAFQGYFTIQGGAGDDTIYAALAPANTRVAFVAGTGDDRFYGGAGNDIVWIAPSALDANDLFSGAGGVDSLAFSAAGTVAAGGFANILGIERILLNAGGNTITLSQDAAASATGGLAVIGGAGNDVVLAGALTSGVAFNPGGGNDRFQGGAGDDQINIAIADLTGGDQFDGGAGRDRIGFTTAGTITAAMLAGLSNIETLSLSSAGPNTVVLGTNLANVNVAGGSDADTVTLALSTQFVSLGAGDDTLVVTAGAVPALAAYGKDGTDTIRTMGGGNFAIAPGIVEFERAVMHDAARLDLSATVMSLDVTGSSGDDTIVLGQVSQAVDGGGGNDTLALVAPDVSLNSLVSGFIVSFEQGKVLFGATGSHMIAGFANAVGSAQGDILDGDGNANRFDGGTGDDQLVGRGGDDTLAGGKGNDLLDGGDGIDTADYSAAAAGIVVDLGQDTTQATNDGDGGQDQLVAIERIVGSRFNDTILGSAATTEIKGGAGDDVLGGFTAANLYGGAGADTADFGTAPLPVVADLMTRSYGYTTLGPSVLDSIENLSGTARGDYLRGDSGANTLNGQDGNDILIGGGGQDTLLGGAGNDAITDTGGVAFLDAGAGNDTATISFGGGTAHSASVVWMTMGAGDDVLNIALPASGAGAVAEFGRFIMTDRGAAGGYTNDVQPGDGNDTVTITGAADTNRFTYVYLYTFAGDDQVDLSASSPLGLVHLGAGNDVFQGGSGNDVVQGGAGDDILRGGGGNDILGGGRGTDLLIGGPGIDTASYSQADDLQGGVTVDLAWAGPQDTGAGGVDTLVDIENLTGGFDNDVLFGNAGANVLAGMTGDDILVGRGGADTIDTGLGNDQVRYLALTDGGDLITGFSVGGSQDSFAFLIAAFPLANGWGTIRLATDTSAAGAIAAGTDVVLRSGLADAAEVDAYLAGAAGAPAGGMLVLAQAAAGQDVSLYYDPAAAVPGGPLQAVLIATLQGATDLSLFRAADFMGF